MKLELLSKPDCCLCDDAKEVLDRVRQDLPFELAVVDLSQHPERLAQHGEEIPVLFIDGRKAFKFHIDETELRARLARSGRQP